MDFVAVYGLMIAGVVICAAATIFVALLLGLALADWGVDVRGPWMGITVLTNLALPIAASIGAVVLVGLSSDLLNFIRAVGGVLLGVLTYLIVQSAGVSFTPHERYVELSDGKILSGGEVDALRSGGGMVMVRRIWFPSDRYVEVEFSDGRSLRNAEAEAFIAGNADRLWPDADPKGISPWAYASGVRREGRMALDTRAFMGAAIAAPVAAVIVALLVADWL